MYYLYAAKPDTDHKLVATFDTQQQLMAYVGWSKIGRNPDGTSEFRRDSALAGYDRWDQSPKPLTDDTANKVVHNPSMSGR